MSYIQFLPIFTRIACGVIGKKNTEQLLNFIIKEEKFYYVNLLYDFKEKKANKQLTLLLPGKGCAWAKKNGGCTMCGFSKKIEQLKRKFSDNDLISLYETAVIMTNKNKVVTISIYNAGSFINNDEISEKVQLEIFRRLEKHPTIKNIFIESRAEYINNKKIITLKRVLEGKNLIVAIGLEAQDDKIRNNYIKKGLSKAEYENAIKILKKNRVRVATYILIKPIYLNEKEAIKEAIKSAEYAFKAGTDEVIFESSFVQRCTIMELLYNEKKFTPPWLWTIIEVLKKTYNLGDVRLGGFSDEPPPIAIPFNCKNCSPRIEQLLYNYRENNNIRVFDNSYCDCKKKWEKIIKP